MIAIDTNILLRWIASDVAGDEDARHQSILIEEVLAASSEPIFINQIVLAEMMWVLRRRVRVSKQILVDVVTSLLDTINWSSMTVIRWPPHSIPTFSILATSLIISSARSTSGTDAGRH